MDSTKVNPSRKTPGQRISAREWNAIVDAFARVEVGSDRASGPDKFVFSGATALALNSTTVALTRFAPFRLEKTSALIFDPTTAAVGAFYENAPVTAMPAADNKSFHSVGIALDEIAIDGYGRCAVSGVVPCTVNIVNEAHRYAKLKTDGVVKLDSCDYGPVEIIWRATGTGDRISLVKLGTAPTVLFPVKVVKTGGSAGDATTKCSFTYTANDQSGVVLGTVLSPKKERPALGAMASPTTDPLWGSGFYDLTGAFVLFDANEVLSTEAC